ncbi:MAG: molybdenum cofactor biosynthesis protein MoaE, partial [Streptomyces sp.]|uniref:molybdenum cofactor biosynthesis protein MoaE n=1 Tax=Streptomyces sp. TaxID=1931 RepID=UPI0025F8299A
LGEEPVVEVVARVTDEPLDAAAMESAHAGSGAVVTFVGRVRDLDGGREVVELEYTAHPSAGEVLRGLAEKVAAEPEVLTVAVAHRTGRLVVGDVALVAVVATAHRAEAFRHCAQLVEDVKHSLPVWKKQVFTDGTHEWVGSC